jgi:hypothetical protein
MKRLMWGVFLFSIFTASAPWQLNACEDKRSRSLSYRQPSTLVTHFEDKTMVISSDDDFVTVTVYDGADSNWM